MVISRTPTTRLLWPDVAKGACILLVVLHHVVGKYVVEVTPEPYGAVAVAWHGFSTALKPVRMPLFFLVSGFFAARAITRPWRPVVRKVADTYYLYVVWLLVFVGVYSLEQTMTANRTRGLGELLADLVWASTSMWFLFALAAYVVVAKLLRGLPRPLVLVAATALTLGAPLLGIEETNRLAVLQHLLFFLVGALAPEAVRRVAAARLSLRALAAAYAVLISLTTLLRVPAGPELLVVSAVGVPFGLLLATRLATTAAARPLAWLGRRTLRVYVLHLVVLAVVVHLPVPLAGASAATGLLVLGLGAVWTAGYPLLVTASVVGVSLGVHAALRAVGLGWLFARPRLDPVVPEVLEVPAGPRRSSRRVAVHRASGATALR